jgi:HPt (histidine-containing phosphotransfer) domain-containing protein
MSLPQPVNLAHLARYTGGDAGIDAEVLTLFADQSVDLLKRLEAALAQSDSKTWRNTAHSIKGAARGIGAFLLADTAAQVEATDPASDAGQAARALHDLKSKTLAVTLFIETHLGHAHA